MNEETPDLTPAHPGLSHEQGGHSPSLECSLRDQLLEDPEIGWPLFWDAYGRDVLSRVHRFRLSPADQEDAVQEVIFHLVKNHFAVIKNWDSSRCRLRTYLSLVVTSRMIDYLRSDFSKYSARKVSQPPPGENVRDLLEDLPSEEISPEERVHRIQVASALELCLQKLTGQGILKQVDCNIVQMRGNGMPFKEISQVLGMTEGSVAARFSRARERILKALSNAGIEASDLVSDVNRQKDVDLRLEDS